MFCLVVLDLSKAGSSDPLAYFPGDALLSAVRRHVGTARLCHVHIKINHILLDANYLEPSELEKAGADRGNGR